MQPIIEVRLAMVDHGYTPIPVIGKKPPLEKWQEITDVSRATLEDWDRDWPDASNTGILTRLTPTIDLDLLNEPAAVAAENLVRERIRWSRLRPDVASAVRPSVRSRFGRKTPFKKLTTNFRRTCRRRLGEDRIPGRWPTDRRPWHSSGYARTIYLDRRRSDDDRL